MRCNGGDLVMTISRGSAENKQLSAPAATWLSRCWLARSRVTVALGAEILM